MHTSARHLATLACVISLLAAACSTLRADELAVAVEAPSVTTTLPDSLGSFPAEELAGYSASDDAIARAAANVEAEIELAEPIAIPEPSAFALLGCLGALMLAMTLLRWHFDRTGATAAAMAHSPQTER